jgi:hypothetical protein
VPISSNFEWKRVELRRGVPFHPNQWREVVSVDKTVTIFVQVPVGEPVVKRQVQEEDEKV